MGGGAMRAAAKMAGFTVANAGLRGITGDNYPVFSSARRGVSALSAAPTPEDMRLVASHSQAGVQRTSSEIEDWVFTGGEEEAMFRAADPMPRVVSGDVPTLQEAQEATSELTAALERAYLSPPHLVNEGSFVADHGSSLSISSTQAVEIKACVSSEIAFAPATPDNAIKAFRLLCENSAAQNVIASISCDPKVWSAVRQNQELQEFLQSERTCLARNTNLNMEELGAESDLLDRSSAKSIDHSSGYAESPPDSGYVDTVQKIKIAVVDMMSSLSDYFHYYFGGQGANRVFANSDGTAESSADTVMEVSFMGLAVMAIMVILLKRA